MAFPTGGGGQQSLSIKLNEILTKAAQVKQVALDAKNRLAAQNIDGAEVFALVVALVNAKSYMASRAAIPGLGEFAKNVFNDAALNIAAEYTAMIAALDQVTALIDTQTPSQLAATIYTPAATTTFRARLQTLADAID